LDGTRGRLATDDVEEHIARHNEGSLEAWEAKLGRMMMKRCKEKLRNVQVRAPKRRCDLTGFFLDRGGSQILTPGHNLPWAPMPLTSRGVSCSEQFSNARIPEIDL